MSAKPGARQWLFNPFTYLAGTPALLIGLSVILIAGFLSSLSNTHFDGVLDVHTGAPAPLAVFLLEGIIGWLCISVVLSVLGVLASKSSVRLLNVFGTQALARLPTLSPPWWLCCPAHRDTVLTWRMNSPESARQCRYSPQM